MALGRPTDYTEELGELICARIVETRTLAEALDVEGLPAPRTIFNWLSRHETFMRNYARAMELRAEPDNEELRRVAYDMEIPADQKRIIVDTLKWQQARAAPKRYGDRHIHQGDAENPIATAVDVSGLSVDVLRALAKLRVPE